MRNTINAGILILCCAAVMLFAACKPFGGDFEEWEGRAKEANGICTVTFNANGGEPAPKAQNIKKGDKAQKPSANPKKDSNVFLDWYTDSKTEDLSKPYNFSDPVTKSITLYAKWKPHYIVTFNKNDGNPEANPSTKTVIYPATTVDTLPTSPTRSGYVFINWNTQANGTGATFTETTPVTDKITVYAQWQRGYTVTFNKNGGDTEADPITKPAVIYPATTVGTLVGTLPTPPTRTGYTFTGWNTETNGYGTTFTETTPVNRDITVYAQWSPAYTVTFNKNGGNTEADPRTKTVISPVTNVGTLPTPPTRTGYTFTGWNTQANGTGTTFTATTTVTGNITVYAQWTLGYTVTFDRNGGNTGADPSTKTLVPPATNIGTLPTPPTRTGYVFAGWNTQANGTGTTFTATTTVTGNITVYAQWTLGYTVTFNANGATSGTAPAPQTANAGSSINLPSGSGLTRSGYVFGGWNTNSLGMGTNYNAGSSYTPTGDITLYARWVTAYTITFSANGGSGTPPSAQTVAAGSGITLPTGSGLSRTGYIFGGWNTDSLGMGTNNNAGVSYTPIGNITLYARWINYTVTFSANNGSGTAPVTQSVAPGSSIDLPSGSGLSRTGYAFGGWNTDTSGTGTTYQSGASYTPTGNVTLYARWIAVQAVSPDRIEYYWVDQHGNLTTTSGGATSIAPGATLAITAQGDGYVVQQWSLNGVNTSQSGNTYTFSSNTIGKHTVGLFVEKDGRFYNTNIIITVGASYPVTVTFNVNGGSGTAPSSQAIATGSSITLPSGSGLSRTGYTFGGWNTNASGTGNNYNAGTSYTPTGDITLYARWGSSGTGSGTEANPISLTAGTWADGSVTSSASAVWYSFNVTSGTTYYIWWNDSYEGNGTKTSIVQVSASYSTGTSIFSRVYGGWTNPRSFTASSSGTVKIRVEPYNNSSGYTGTFAVAYRTTSTRP